MSTKKPNGPKNTNGTATPATGGEDKLSNASSGAGDANGDKKGDLYCFKS